MDKEVENLDDHGCPKVQNLLDEEMWNCSSYPFRHNPAFYCGELEEKTVW